MNLTNYNLLKKKLLFNKKNKKIYNLGLFEYIKKNYKIAIN